MKRILCGVLVMVLVLSILPIYGNAAENKAETIYFEDGSYMIVETITSGSRASGSLTGSKPATYYSSSGVAQWKAVLTGSFTYTGSSAVCTASSVAVTVYNSTWYEISKSASKSGDTATASVTMGQKVGGITTLKVPADISLTCDANGNLS